LTAALLKDFEMQIGNFTLVPSDGGRFEVSVNGELIYSKLKSGRHVQAGEVNELFRKYVEENPG
jgi:selenoprotein W-related protein